MSNTTTAKTIIDVLRSQLAELPKTRPNKQSYLNYLNEIHQEFVQEIKGLNQTDPLSKAVYDSSSSIEHIVEGVYASIYQYLDGSPHKAYKALSDCLASPGVSILPRLKWKIESADLSARKLFRARLSDSAVPLDSPGLFHIPFHLRHLVATQRYSIPGYPCLYLGSTSYVCWRELGMPNPENISVSRFQANQDFVVLDLAHPPSSLVEYAESLAKSKDHNSDEYKSTFQKTLDRIIMWPLVAACSIKVLHTDAPFKVEYIVPQLLLQFVTSDPSIDGISYFSVELDKKSANTDLLLNYAFPTRTWNDQESCPQLRSMFEMTEPMSLGFLNIGPSPSPHPDVSKSTVNLGQQHAPFYYDTAFGRLDSFLCSRKTLPIP